MTGIDRLSRHIAGHFALTDETASERAWKWLEVHRSDAAISWWVETEVSAALSLKVRTGQIPLERRNSAFASFKAIVVDALTILPVSKVHFETAAGFANRNDVAIRAADALHLAIASERESLSSARSRETLSLLLASSTAPLSRIAG